jgi:hypothetical protein
MIFYTSKFLNIPILSKVLSFGGSNGSKIIPLMVESSWPMMERRIAAERAYAESEA